MERQVRGQLEVLNQLVKELSGIYHHAAGKFGISDNEFWVWYALLVLGGEYSQQDICDLWCLPKQTVNSVVTNLVKKDFAVLETVPGTRNRKIIRLTPEGKDFGGSVVSHIYTAELETIRKFSDEERQTGIVLLGKYINLLQEELHERPEDP